MTAWLLAALIPFCTPGEVWATCEMKTKDALVCCKCDSMEELTTEFYCKAIIRSGQCKEEAYISDGCQDQRRRGEEF